MVKDIFRGLAVLICGIVLAMVAMILIYALPTGRMMAHVQKSVSCFEREGYSYNNFTDSIMLSSAVFHEDKGLIDKAVNTYHERYKDDSGTVEALIRYANGEEDGVAAAYPRYWHGYLLFLKPLLIFVSYPTIRSINYMCQALLISLIFFMLFKRSMTRYAVPVFISYISLGPVSLSMSMQCSFVFYIAYLALLIELLFHERLTRTHYRMFFLLIGMSTSFLDFLTYPLITYGLPITLFLILQPKWDRRLYGEFIILSAFWCVGYVGMWAGKWLAATILNGRNMFTDAINSIIFRTSMGSYNNVTWTLPEIYVMKLTQLISNREILLTLLGGFVLCGIWLIQTRKGIRQHLRWLPILTVTALTPFAWYTVASNHSAIHLYEYRTLGVTVFALFCLLVRLSDMSYTEEPKLA